MLEVPFLSRFLASTYSRRLDDLVDRLHFEFTVWVLVLFSMFVGGKQHFGEPIQCMLPAHMSQSSWISYAQYYCFITNTYRLTYTQTVPDVNTRSQLRNADGVNLTYYQWVPYFLVFQAFCFYFPNWLWRLLQTYVLDMQTIVDEAVAIRNEIEVGKREERMSKLVDYISSSFYFSSGLSDKSLFSTSSQCSGYLAVAYIMSKLLMIANDFAQLYLIAYFLGIKDVTWALHPFLLSQNVAYGTYNFTANYFPRVTFCDINRVTLAGKDTDTLQCVVMLNVINEKIFLFLFYWITALTAIAVSNFMYVTFKLFFRRETIIKFYVQGSGDNENDFFLKTDKLQLYEFVRNVFRYDGVLLLHFLDAQAGAIVTRDVVASLWRSFFSHVKKPFEVNRVHPLTDGFTMDGKRAKDLTAFSYGQGGFIPRPK